MTEAGRSLRLGRLLKSERTPLFLVPMDHTVTDGPLADTQRYCELIGILADNGADAIIVHKGRLRLLDRTVYSKLLVIVHVSASARYAHDPNDKYPVADAEDCLRRTKEEQQIGMLASAADACDRAGLPFIAMVYPRGPGVKAALARDGPARRLARGRPRRRHRQAAARRRLRPGHQAGRGQLSDPRWSAPASSGQGWPGTLTMAPA